MHNTHPPYRRQPRRRKPTVHHFVAVDLTVGSPPQPALSQVLAATDLSAGAPVLGAPALGQVHNLKSATTPGRHDLVAVDVAVGLPVIGADPVDEQPKPQSCGRQRSTKEIRVIRILCALAVEGVPIARLRNRQGDLILKREVENQRIRRDTLATNFSPRTWSLSQGRTLRVKSTSGHFNRPLDGYFVQWTPPALLHSFLRT